MNYSIDLNKYYVAFTSILILILLGGSIYFMAVVLRFKSRVLTFFAEIDREAMIVCAKTSHEFYKFLVNDDPEQLNQSKMVLETHLNKKLQAHTLDQRINLRPSAISDNVRQYGKQSKRKDKETL